MRQGHLEWRDVKRKQKKERGGKRKMEGRRRKGKKEWEKGKRGKKVRDGGKGRGREGYSQGLPVVVRRQADRPVKGERSHRW